MYGRAKALVTFVIATKVTKKASPYLPEDLKNQHVTKIRKLAALKQANFLT